jgi:tripartite-type tricarboxylate transporter receptor subunit TctC
VKKVHWAASAAIAIGATTALSVAASAQTYPTKPITMIVGFAPNGPNDILGRLIAKPLSERLGQPIVVENKAGASSNIGTEAVVRAQPDGYTILFVGPANAINSTLFKNLPFDFRKDIVPIGGITRENFIMVVNPSVPVKTVGEFLAYAKANPGKVSMASTGNGSSPHVSGLLFTKMAGIDLPLLKFNGGGPALKEMIADKSQIMMFEPLSAAIDAVKAGQLRALGVTSTTGLDALPGVPPVSDTVAGYTSSSLSGLGAPKGTPREVIDRLNKELNAVLTDPKVRASLMQNGGTPLGGTPEDFGKALDAEIAKWGEVVVSAGVKPD